MEKSRRAVFIDKDGTLLVDVPYNVASARMRLMPGAAPALAALQRAGWALFVVSNQPGVARGVFPETALAAVEERLRGLLAESGAELAGFYYCPHDPAGVVPAYAVSCDCRKPQPGLILRACRRHGLEPADCWLVGDILDDVEAGRRAGCRAILLDNGHETEWRREPLRAPEAVAADLPEAALHILTAP
ncbi:MAG TPA: HAD family hydrolase [Elusimicrobiota bacterium]|jgi:histidinol-phosphate phosphatase family protein|nr:HAD family hydrolase [Elusimicrobiota bacterium]